MPDLIRGAAGVDIFFVISGFVIARSASALPAERGAGYFFARRLIRIVPLYWSVTLLYLALAILLADRGNTFTLPLALTSFAFIPFPRADGFIQPVIGQGWSLNYEMLFYAIYACCLGLGRRSAGFLAIGTLALIAIIGLWPSGSPQIEFWTSGIMLEFAAGIALAELHARGLRLARAPAAALAAAGVALILFAPLSPAEFGASRVFWVGIPALLLVGSIALADRAAAHCRIAMGDPAGRRVLRDVSAAFVPKLYRGRGHPLARTRCECACRVSIGPGDRACRDDRSFCDRLHRV